MTPERWDAVKRLFHDALEREPAERAAYVAEAAKSDPALADEVRALLSAQGQADDAFDSLTRTGGLKTLAAGTRLGPYEIVSLVGAGGMGEVYRARDTRLNRTVAVKVLPADVAADPGLRTRFEREARTISSLSHPHICALYDVGEQDGRSFLVMEYLEGDTLTDRLAKGPLPLDQALRHATEIAEALAEAHQHGVIHRDLKPGNVMLTKKGAKLLDFGIAKLRPGVVSEDAPTATASALTGEGQIVGTLQYMAPEQLEGKPVDARTDVFAFGLVVYEMVTGRKAFEASSRAGLIGAILEREPPPLRSLQAGAPVTLEELVSRCLEKDPSRRWQGAQEMLGAFARARSEASAASGAQVPPLGQPGGWPASRRAAAGVALAAVALAAAGSFLARQWHRDVPQGSAPPAASHDKSIAVLPFQNLSPDPENAFFADGITEDILTQLAKVGGLKVIARTSVMRYKGTDRPVREIARELGVATVLEGSVRRAGNRVRIVGQLIDARTEQHLWAETYDRELQDVFAIQTDVAERIASALRTTFTPADRQRIAQRPTGSVEAYDLYLKGRERYYRYEKDDNDEAIALFRKALAVDPRFALAQAGLADALYQRYSRFGSSPSDHEASVEAARKAVELDPQLAEAHKALALTLVGSGHIREAVDENRRAVELQHATGFVGVANLGNTLFFLGRFDEGLRWLRRSAELDPTNAVTLAALGNVYEALGDGVRAEATLRKAFDLNPKLGQAHVMLVTSHLRRGQMTEALQSARKAASLLPDDPYVLRIAAVAELIAGDGTLARKLFERLLPALEGQRRAGVLPDAGVETYLAYIEARAGRRSSAQALADRAAAADKRHLDGGNEHWSVPFDLACVHTIQRNKDQALLWLDRAHEAGWRGWPQASWSPLLDPLRDEERFKGLISRIDSEVAEMRRRAGLER